MELDNIEIMEKRIEVRFTHLFSSGKFIKVKPSQFKEDKFVNVHDWGTNSDGRVFLCDFNFLGNMESKVLLGFYVEVSLDERGFECIKILEEC